MCVHIAKEDCISETAKVRSTPTDYWCCMCSCCCLQLEQLFSSGFSLHAEDASDHFAKAAAAAQQEQQKAADLQPTSLPSSTNPPLDWSVKTAIRFSSPEPFVIAEEAACVSAGTGENWSIAAKSHMCTS